MQNKTLDGIVYGTRAFALTAAALSALAMTGCGVSSPNSAATGPLAGAGLKGQVHGGQQPIIGATIQLYAANQTGYGQNSTALIGSTVTTDVNGYFTITGDYTCPYASSQVYITATGGNSGSGSNANIVQMAPLGACGSLSSSTFVSINELTTVAGAYALAPFMSSPTQLSTTPTNVTGLTNAFATVNKLVNIGNGYMPGSTLPTGATEPSALLNTLADILASCVNTNGLGGSSNTCSMLFGNATPPGGSTPADTLTAVLDIAKNPSNNASMLFPLATPSAPYQPTLPAAPSAYTVSIRYAPTGTFSTPSASAVDASGNVWVTNSGNNTIAVLGATTGIPTIYSGGGLNAPSGIAFDASGNAWVPNQGNSTLSAFTASGTGSVALTSNLNAPTAVAIDGQGVIWLTNSGGNSTTAVTASGVNVTGSSNYSGGGSGPVAIAINPH
jgi:hypothetical protein